ncbi:hypothetical protein DYB28_009186 [Aphanomyces astaci]|uniref:Polycystin cation channel PKD1/PKD2 domain-containing protein n=1 Tax=Aphanomyces astaci TaxID=112090 RepID=A0A9X8H855_APHAT|nr:hypothetical protein DYB28_009186 [Aphanomyces astaci]
MQMSWIFRAVVHTLLVVGMTYHAVDVDSHLLPYSRNLYNELWRLLNGDDQDQPLNLFTIRRGVDHVHLVLANYFSLPDVALGKLHVAPFAAMEVQSHKPSLGTLEHKAVVHRDYMRWKVQFKYNFSTQGQIQLHMAVTRQLPTPPSRIGTTARSPTDYIWRYVGLIVLSGGYLVRMPSRAPVLVYVEPLSWTYAVASMGQWLSLLRFLSFNPRTYILGLTLKRGAPQVVEFLIGVCPLFVGYVLFGTIMFGATLYLYSYIVIFAYVVLMVCIGIMEDAFFTSAFPSLWKQSTATLTEDQWRHVVELIHDRTKASHPDMVACQTDILTHVERQLF